MFQEEEFIQACKELDEPDVSDYDFFTESHDVKIYRQYNKVTRIAFKNVCSTYLIDLLL